jgi:hypothetical protein
MKGSINKHGQLCIERKGKLKPQDCYQDRYNGVPCSDSCPHFGEPKTADGITTLTLTCGACADWRFDEFVDER